MSTRYPNGVEADIAATAGSIGTAELASNAITTAKITDANVTYAKIQNVSATNTILGRKTAGAGVVEEITVAGDLTQSGSTFTIANAAVTTAKLDATTIQYAAVALTNANMLNLRATPIQLVAAPGAGYVLEFISATLLFDYTAAYTETADNMAVKYENGSGAAASEDIEATGFVDATADTITFARKKLDGIVAKTGAENKALVLHNIGDGEYGGGNASNAVRVKVAYRVHATGF